MHIWNEMSANCRYMCATILCIITAWHCYSASTNSHSAPLSFLITTMHLQISFVWWNFRKKRTKCLQRKYFIWLFCCTYICNREVRWHHKFLKCKQISPFYQIKCFFFFVCVNMSNGIQTGKIKLKKGTLFEPWSRPKLSVNQLQHKFGVSVSKQTKMRILCTKSLFVIEKNSFVVNSYNVFQIAAKKKDENNVQLAKFQSRIKLKVNKIHFHAHRP